MAAWPVYWNRPVLLAGGDAVGVVGVDRELGPGGIAGGHDRALVIGMQVAPAGGGHRRPLVPDERLIDPGAVHIAAQQGAAAVVLGDQAIPVVDEAGGVGAAYHLVEPPERVVGEAGILGPTRAHQPVLGVVAERGRVVAISRWSPRPWGVLILQNLR